MRWLIRFPWNLVCLVPLGTLYVIYRLQGTPVEPVRLLRTAPTVRDDMEAWVLPPRDVGIAGGLLPTALAWATARDLPIAAWFADRVAA